MNRRAYLSTVAGAATFVTAGCSEVILPTGDPPAAGDVTSLVHEKINAVRDDHDLSRLAFDEDLQEVARYHSQDMADQEYFAHESPQGETRADRYERFDYDCRVPVDEKHHATGGENIWNINYSGRSFSAEEIAERAVTDWMDSPNHRENILHHFWRREGLGMATRNDDEVRLYLTQNFC